MMRILYIAGFAAAGFFIFSSFYFQQKIESFKQAEGLYAFLPAKNPYTSYNAGPGLQAIVRTGRYTISTHASLCSFVFLLFFETLFVLSLLKIKTKTMKVISLTGIILSGIYLTWAALALSTPSRISFDEIAGALAVFGLVLAAFSVVGITQAFKTKT